MPPVRTGAMPSKMPSGVQTERVRILPGVLLFGLVLWTFFSAIQNGFVGYDDPNYVTANRHVRQGLSWTEAEWAFSNTDQGNWHPLTWLSHMLDCQLFGLQPWGHHLINVVLHALNALLVFLVFKELTGAAAESFMIAALFALHPLRVESVAWIAERKDVLSTLFWMLTLWAYVKYARKRIASDQPARPFWWLALMFFSLGLMCKPMLVTVPCALLLLDYWPLNRWRTGSIRSLIVEKIPFFLVAAMVAGLTVVAQHHGGAMHGGWSLVVRLENAAISYCRYLMELFAPVNLAVFYPYPQAWPATAWLPAIILLAAISFLAIHWRRQKPFLLTGWFWFVGTLVPVIGLVQVGEQSMADRYSYVPSLGIFLILVRGLVQVTGGWRYRRVVLSAISIVTLVCCIKLTREQIGYWRDSETLFEHALSVTKGNYLAHNNLGTALDQQQRLDEAIQEFQAAIAEKPGYAEAHNNLGLVLIEQNRPEEAISQFEEALKIQPGYAAAHNGWAMALNQQGRDEEAIIHYREATRLNPDYEDAHYNLGVALGRAGQADEAIVEFQKTLRLNPDSSDAYNNLGVTLGKKGRIEEAIVQYRNALRLKPDFAVAHFNLGVALLTRGDLDQSIAEFEEALRLHPDYPAAKKNLDAAFALKSEGKKTRTPDKP